MLLLWMSNTNCGFLMTFTQNLRGRLHTQKKNKRVTMYTKRVPDVRVADLPLVRLLVQEVEHVFDGQWESRAPVGGAKDGLKQVVHELLQRPLVCLLQNISCLIYCYVSHRVSHRVSHYVSYYLSHHVSHYVSHYLSHHVSHHVSHYVSHYLGGQQSVPVSWSGVIIGALDLRLSGLEEVRSNDSE
ncbi:hypothetical protein EYF80_033133 [Liparis tanakae]|uniref:Uncharacterized protein n=1 Tax=Liparis tanakae TaxID=230148 RepID=A0A4Z2GSW6_9TELE|nr:hypothetical protein EYF80_033133 [Liparis tanakae]